MIRAITCFTLFCLLVVNLHAAGSPAPGMNEFATSLYRQLAGGDDNLIFSPFSISTAVSMVLNGARGQTAAQIAQVLHQLYPDPQYDTAVSALADELAKAADTGGNELVIANGLWVQRGFAIEPDFSKTVQTIYRAPLSPLDFEGNAEGARSAINSWTAQKTKRRIQELFKPGSLDSHTRLVLTSAIYFYGKWQSVFRPGSTHPAPFRLTGGGTAETKFMHQTAMFGYAETPLLQILEMRYMGTPLTFDVLLPKTNDGLAGLEKSLSPDTLAACCSALKNQRVDVTIPKFRVEAEFSLRDTLSRMGMPEAFQRSADLSGIDARRDLFLSDVRHKAFVDVAEEGTEAAAATGASVSLMSAIVGPPPVVFRADHPFLFLIRDTRSGVILFAGRLMKP
jgi:serpin B